MMALRAAVSVGRACQVLGLSRSGYYAWATRVPSVRACRDAVLIDHIRAAHVFSHGTYGAPRVHAELTKGQGLYVSRKRVARLMRQTGLQGISRRKWTTTTVRTPGVEPAFDLVERDFTATGPNRLWVADITYVPTWAGFLYLAVVLDVWSRRIVGWSFSTNLRTELVDAALNMAVRQRQPSGVIHHSDHGSQYTAIDFGKRCRKAGVRSSMGTVGDAYDNAMCESFFATLECECLARHKFPTPAAAESVVFSFIEGWYNPHRRHSSLDMDSPIAFERRTLVAG